jgi:hypothetical protein
MMAEGETDIVAATGYLHPGYAESLAEFGTPKELSGCKGWILKRRIPDSPYYDGMGCYPLFVCRDWSKLSGDLEELGDELVSLAVVTDPFGEYDETLLRQCFDFVIPFKKHFIADLSRPLREIVSKHRHYFARKALRRVCVEICEVPMHFIDDWIALYDASIEKFNIRGIRAFSKNAFIRQFAIPGFVLLRAVYKDISVGFHVMLVQGEVAFGHLGAYSELGYKLGASYALHLANIQHFQDKLRWIDWGGSAGIKSDGKDGLSEFKMAFSTETRATYFCGRIFNHERYSEIVKAKGIPKTDYFPEYREGEFE